MSGRFVSKDDDVVIQAEWWDEDESVTIKVFSYGDRQFLIKKTMRVGLNVDPERLAGDDGNITGEALATMTDLQLGEMNLAILDRGIRSWTLKGPQGKVVVPSRRWIEQLSERDAEFILEKINELNPSQRRSAEEQEGFRAGS